MAKEACEFKARQRKPVALAHLYRVNSRLVSRCFFRGLSCGLCCDRAGLGRSNICRWDAELGRRHDRGTPAAFQLRHVEVEELLRGLADVQQQLGAGEGKLAQDSQRPQHAVGGGEVGEAEALLCPCLRIC